MLVRPNKQSQSFVNLESEEKFYTSDKHFCPQDGFVAFRRGELISGNLGDVFYIDNVFDLVEFFNVFFIVFFHVLQLFFFSFFPFAFIL